MPFSNINIILTPAQIAAIQGGLNTLKSLANLPVQFNLTKGERGSLQNISNERYPYVQRSVQIHGPNNAGLASAVAGAGAGTLAEATNDFTFREQMENFIQQLVQILEIYQDTQHVASHEAYGWMKVLYGVAQTAAKNQVPGADAVADDLKTLFDKEEKEETPPL